MGATPLLLAKDPALVFGNSLPCTSSGFYSYNSLLSLQFLPHYFISLETYRCAGISPALKKTTNTTKASPDSPVLPMSQLSSSAKLTESMTVATSHFLFLFMRPGFVLATPQRLLKGTSGLPAAQSLVIFL